MHKNRQRSSKKKEKHLLNEVPAGQVLRDDHYTVQRIKNKRNKGAYYEYLVEWVGFPGQDTWERMENLEYVTALVDEYEERVKAERSKKKFHVFVARGRIAEVNEEKEASLDSSKGERKESLSKYCYALKREKDTEESKPMESAQQLSRKEEQSIDKGSIDKSSIDKSSIDKPSIDKTQTDKLLPTGRLLKPASIKFSGQKLQYHPQTPRQKQPLKILKPSSITFPSSPHPLHPTSMPFRFVFP